MSNTEYMLSLYVYQLSICQRVVANNHIMCYSCFHSVTTLGIWVGINFELGSTQIMILLFFSSACFHKQMFLLAICKAQSLCAKWTIFMNYDSVILSQTTC